ncbi:Isopenicillin N synthase [Thiothrix eikelboomii]|uniref:2-oxoglutarate-dependent ethylene/succinate-forming enzyme n=1 Tax=Thiothrix eikelboomii TaxID=92487 RepID=A0A1T4XNL6_9GAMM|nr:2OG-Fe(II) oxygenase family protein [Thiothrix eikelboomii]SKA90701.1 Isopenicillin N synthase [Thiothrix eikelboomii]
MGLYAVDYLAPNAGLEFVASLHEFGFGILKNHPIPQASVESIYAHWLNFFQSTEKYNYRFRSSFDGYFPPEVSETAKGCAERDIKEYFHFYHPWGICPEALRPELIAYRQQANALAEALLGWIEAYSPPEVAALYHEPLSTMIRGSEQTLLRVLHYPPFQGSEPSQALRAAAHEDINLLTVLPAANEPGLQVLTQAGEWLDVPCDFGYLIVNIGDMLQEASGGYFPSTTHRVINPPPSAANVSRISLPLFLHPRPEVVLSERYTADSYLQERLRELGFK